MEQDHRFVGLRGSGINLETGDVSLTFRREDRTTVTVEFPPAAASLTFVALRTHIRRAQHVEPSEGPRWVQTLKSEGVSVIPVVGSNDLLVHVGTEFGFDFLLSMDRHAASELARQLVTARPPPWVPAGEAG